MLIVHQIEVVERRFREVLKDDEVVEESSGARHAFGFYDVPISGSSSSHIFIAGGIGITIFLFHIDIYAQINFNYELHYVVHSADDIPYRNLLEKMGANVTIYDKSKGERINISKILENRKWNSYVYVWSSANDRRQRPRCECVRHVSGRDTLRGLPDLSFRRPFHSRSNEVEEDTAGWC